MCVKYGPFKGVTTFELNNTYYAQELAKELVAHDKVFPELKPGSLTNLYSMWLWGKRISKSGASSELKRIQILHR